MLIFSSYPDNSRSLFGFKEQLVGYLGLFPSHLELSSIPKQDEFMALGGEFLGYSESKLRELTSR